MATEAQILTNRRNAQKSTGARTPEGKAAVSQNAVKDAFFARFGGIGGKFRRAGTLSMQNKPNFQKAQISVNIYSHKDYENSPALRFRKNKAKQTQFQDPAAPPEEPGKKGIAEAAKGLMKNFSKKSINGIDRYLAMLYSICYG